MPAKSAFPLIDDRKEILEEARPFRDMSPENRIAVFRGLLETVSAIWMHLPEEERRRRLLIGERLDPRPNPWWKNIPSGGLP